MIHPYNDLSYILTVLIKADLITREDASNVISKIKTQFQKGNKDYVQWIVSLNVPKKGRIDQTIEEADIISLIAKEQGWTFHRLDPLKMDMEVVTKSYPATFAKKRLAIPFAWIDGTLEVVCYDPLDPELKHDIERASKAIIVLSVATRSDIETVIREFYDFKRSIVAAENILQSPEVDISNLEQFVSISPDDKNTEKHINIAVEHLLKYAIEQRGSDIHFEPKRHQAIVRLRIDGMLHPIYRLPKVVNDAVCSRIKVLSRMDLTEKRRPQDGRMKIAWKTDEIEIRVSSVPCAFGEKIVLRIQTPDIMFRDLTELGFSSRDFDVYSSFTRKTFGIILITGPTGSGKSTTLYSSLRHINSPDINIISVEDPVEMIHEDFNQIAVQVNIDVTFSTILRNILRQDPDVIMIGEIRDNETARHAVQCALTGHLVFSTLHTNDAISAITRMRDLGIETYLLSSTMVGVVAQRLIRLICPNCREDYTMPAVYFNELGFPVEGNEVSVAKGKGCIRCRNTGYFGRIGIYEIMPVTDAIKEMIHKGEDEMLIRKLAIKEGMTPLLYDGLRKTIDKITTFDEVIKVTAL
jgi:general secretion pathway protein E